VLGPADVGHRVVVRRRAGETAFADVLGHLVELTESEITVEGRVDRVRIPRHEVVTAKRIPDRRRLTATERLELVAADGWPAPDRSTLGRWLLRAADGWTARGNSALAVGDPDRPLPAAVDAVTDWYTARDLPPRIALPDPVGGRLAALLTDLGWTASPRTEVRTRSLSAVVRPDPRVPVEPAPRPAWFTAVGAHKGGLPAVAKQILTGVPVAGFAGLYAGDTARAVGRGVVTDGWLGISLVSVDPGHRRQGLARSIMDALIAWGQAAGATQAYLQVEAHNTAAVAMYDRLGFAVHHTYATWTAPG
jgi:ribosomal protein S18 acetylase RimI-like enzyme